MKEGEIFSIVVPLYRKWWQFWRPRKIGQEFRVFTVVSVVAGQLTGENHAGRITITPPIIRPEKD